MTDYNNIDLHKIARTIITQYGFDFTITKPIIDEINALDTVVAAANNGDLYRLYVFAKRRAWITI